MAQTVLGTVDVKRAAEDSFSLKHILRWKHWNCTGYLELLGIIIIITAPNILGALGIFQTQRYLIQTIPFNPHKISMK